MMFFASPPFRAVKILCGGALFAFVLVPAFPVFGASNTKNPPNQSKAKANEAAAERDSAPVLMSRTGGGSTFADVKELKAAAEKGNPKAQAQFGEMLLRGDAANEVAQDQVAGIVMLEKAARAGEASAAFRIGMLLDDGDGVAQDRVRALAYFKAAAAGGAMEAFHNIGAAYASARGVKRDYTEGLAWLMVAKKRGAPSEGEQALRERVQKLGRPEVLTAAAKRAGEIEKEITDKKVADLLPPPAAFGAPANGAVSSASSR